MSEGEARALEEAAEMLDAQRLPDEALPALDTPPAQEQSPAEMTGDSEAETPQ
ncbi:MAG: hypothetical protein AAGE86_15415 [Pseudomonadota bacterium]